MPEDRNTEREFSEMETEAFLRRSAISYIECAIALAVSYLPPEEVAGILRDEAESLKDFY